MPVSRDTYEAERRRRETAEEIALSIAFDWIKQNLIYGHRPPIGPLLANRVPRAKINEMVDTARADIARAKAGL